MLHCARKIPVWSGFENPVTLKGRTKSVNCLLRHLSPENLDIIMDLEVMTNIPEIYASPERILYRFSKGNQALGLFIPEENRLIGEVAWRYGQFYPDKPNDLPKTFATYSTPSDFPPVNFNGAFHYGINIDPLMRKEGLGGEICKLILNALESQARLSGCEYLVSDPRLHSYNGSLSHPNIEKIHPDPRLKKAVDESINGEKDFTLKDALRDPVFHLYYKLYPGLQFLKLMSNSWFPQDLPSGGHGFYVFKEI